MEANLMAALMTPVNGVIIFAVWVIMGLINKFIPDAAKSVWARLQPIAPLLLAMAALLLPGLSQASLSERMLTGVILGWAAANAHKFFNQSILGNDEWIKPVS